MQVSLRLAEESDLPALCTALRALAASMGDTYAAPDQLMLDAGFGPYPAYRAILAEAAGQVVGVAVFSPFISTTRGRVGTYISDLWVAETLRGKNLGPRLMASVRDHAQGFWGGTFLRLAVYDDNPRAMAFYHRLGFAPKPDEIWMTLEGERLAQL